MSIIAIQWLHCKEDHIVQTSVACPARQASPAAEEETAQEIGIDNFVREIVRELYGQETALVMEALHVLDPA